MAPRPDRSVVRRAAGARARLAAALSLGPLLLAACAQPGLVPAPPAVSLPPEAPPDLAVLTTSPAAPGPQVTVVGVGDIIMGNTPDLPPDGARGFFDAVRGSLRGDVVSGNIDAAITDRAESTKCRPGAEQCFVFRFPPAYAQVLKSAGFTVLSLANNHSHDYGAEGLSDTQQALRSAGLQPTGLPGQIAVQSVGGVNVAVVGFAPYDWSAQLLNIPAAQALVRKARSQADVVIVNMHAGGEGADFTHVRPGEEQFAGEDRGDAMAFAHAVVDAGAAVVLGHSPHVLRGMEWYHHHLIAYSLGNFAGYHSLSSGGVLGAGGILRLTLRQDGSVASGTLVATRMTSEGLPAVDGSREGVGLVNTLSAADFASCAATLSDQGELAPGRC